MKRKNIIDYSEIPATDEAFWHEAQVHLPKQKKSLTIRLDSEVIEWFKEEGKGYQTKINAVLRSYVKAHPHLTFSRNQYSHNRETISL